MLHHELYIRDGQYWYFAIQLLSNKNIAITMIIGITISTENYL